MNTSSWWEPNEASDSGVGIIVIGNLELTLSFYNFGDFFKTVRLIDKAYKIGFETAKSEIAFCIDKEIKRVNPE